MKITNTQSGALTIAGIDIAGKSSVDVTDDQFSAMKAAAKWAFDDGWLATDGPVKVVKDGAKLRSDG